MQFNHVTPHANGDWSNVSKQYGRCAPVIGISIEHRIEHSDPVLVMDAGCWMLHVRDRQAFEGLP